MGEFESTMENPALVEHLRERIEREGPITFHDYMETVLYHPQLGYYASRQPMGREADYLTSPEVHPMFGSLIGKQLAEMWHAMGEPDAFDVVEQGAGTGRLVHDLLRWASRREPAFFSAMTYRIVEISASLRERQRQTLVPLPDSRVEWLDELPDAIDGVVLTNELLDSFPVHRVRAEAAGLSEVFVAAQDGRFVDELRSPSTMRIEEHFAAVGIKPPEGCTVEVNLHAVDWIVGVAAKLRRGFVLTLDYGYEANELYAPWRTAGTLMCFYQHNPSHDPYARIGKQDMTAHIDFTSIKRAGEKHGLEEAGYTTQARFLANMGLGAALQDPVTEKTGGLEEYYARRRAATELIDHAGLGRIRVLAQRKGVEAKALGGFADGDTTLTSTPLPQGEGQQSAR